MKKSILIATAGVIVVGGLTLAAIYQWGGTSESVSSADQQTSTQVSENQSKNTQLQESSNSIYGFAYNVNENIYRVEVSENGFSDPIAVASEADLEVIEMEKYFTTSVMPKDVFEALPISANMIFYSGLQSNLDPSLWFYTERADEKENFNVRMYNVSTKESKVLFNKSNSPNNELAFKPFAVSNDNSVVYLEAFHFDSYLNHVEIWEMNLSTLAFRELNVHSFYDYTPTMSPDGKYLLYPAASTPSDVHVTPNQLYVYDLEKDEESRIIADEKAFVGMKGWIKSK